MSRMPRVSPKIRKRLQDRFADVPCHYCGGPAGTVDHVLPRSKGGSNNAWNVVSACWDCNQEKADDLWPDHCAACAAAVAKEFERLGFTVGTAS